MQVNETERTQLISRIIGEPVYEEVPSQDGTLKNFTPHEICLVAPDCSNLLILVVIPSSGPPARCVEQTTNHGIFGVNCKAYGGAVWPNTVKKSYSEVQNLPDDDETSRLIVSTLVAQALPHREDLYVVDREVRDDQGRIIACRGLAQLM